MRRISDVELINAYKIAIEQDLDRDFVKMLEEELESRGIHIQTTIEDLDE
ncbi:sporulation histidine kinase inhibitor Sda [Paenibacillus naphthalenovorans]